MIDNFTQALTHHQAGRLREAEQHYRQVPDTDPRYAAACNNLGAILCCQNKPEEAATCYRLALEQKPGYAEAHNNLGNVLTEQGQLDEAIACYRRALDLKPNYADAINNFGNAFKELGKLDEAVACYRRALELEPNYADALINLGNVLPGQGKLDEAVACCRRALELKPNYAEALNNLGNVLTRQGKLDEAMACYRRALELKPDYAEAHNNLGILLMKQGKSDDAMACYRRALELKPDYVEANFNLGNILSGQGKLNDAVACYRRAVELKPDHAGVHHNLGIALQGQGKLREAVACYRRALELKPDYAEALNALGNAFKEQGKLDEAVACYRCAVELKPDYLAALGALVHQLQHLCCWDGLMALSQRVIAIVDGCPGGGANDPVAPFTFFGLPTPTTAQQQLRSACAWANGRLKAKNAPRYVPASHQLTGPKAKITIGYLSADFHSHATAWLVAELFEKHDRDRVAVYGYSYGPSDSGAMRRRLVSAFDRFVDMRELSFPEAAQRIATDEVDILVDLKGYTKDGRTEIMAYRPAPIQVNYLGYPGSMGAPFMDYILVDDYIVPSDQQPFFTEKLVYLPGCYQVNDSQREVSPRTPSRAECKLPPDGFVFCCFNNSYKITPDMFDVWMRLLKAVPGSVLWLLEGNRFVPGNLQKEAQARGVPSERLVFAPRLPLPDHLARHRLADLFLDSFPVNAHTTASDALWAGLPVLTLSGQTFASRVAGSLLRTLGLPELITTSLQEYEQSALRLVEDPELLRSLRARLGANRKTCGLFDGGRFARNVEKAYATMWEIYASGSMPRSFSVSET